MEYLLIVLYSFLYVNDNDVKIKLITLNLRYIIKCTFREIPLITNPYSTLCILGEKKLPRMPGCTQSRGLSRKFIHVLTHAISW